MKDLTVEPAGVVIQKLCMVIFQKGKGMMSKMVNWKKKSITNNVKKLWTIEKHQSNVTSMCVVPVKVKSAAQGKDVLIYVMLDNCSQVCLYQEALVKNMQTSGRKETLNLKTLNSEISETTIAIDGLQFPRLKELACLEKSCYSRDNWRMGLLEDNVIWNCPKWWC